MSSPYAVLENRSLDQWKVTELKEELKRRKLLTKGLKDDLVKRLDEAIRAEMEETNQNHDNGVNDIDQPEVPSDDAPTVEPIVAEKTTSIMEDSSAKNKSVEEDNETEKFEKTASLEKDNMTENLINENKDMVIETDRIHVADAFQSLTKESKPEDGELKSESQLSKEEVNPNPSDIGSHVVEVSQVKSDSISIDTISITEKSELKDTGIADDVKLELDVKPEMVQPLFSNVVLDGGKIDTVISVESHKDKVTTEEKDINIAETIDTCKRNDSGDVGSPEKLNLDRSSGDDSMDEDQLESKHIDSKLGSQDIGDIDEKTEVPLAKEDESVDVMVGDAHFAKNMESTKDTSNPLVAPTKRKLHDQKAVANSGEVVKRQHRWNSEGIKVPELQSPNSLVSNTPKNAFQAKHSFSRSDSLVRHEEPKERIVPPSSKPPTTSLRIDRFLRPFTLKAVQELLGKTGTVVSFWMDHIKTHCYVTYSSVEEAVETRNAVYNLQWPTNGGRLLIAEFVDPLEVKSRTEAPPTPSPATPVSATTPTTTQLPPPPPPPLHHQLPPPPPLLLPPPPPLPLPPPSREPPALALPPPPPLPRKVDPPVVTLDDLFRKTRSTPRIYYLPLSDEQVAAKLKSQGKTAMQ